MCDYIAGANTPQTPTNENESPIQVIRQLLLQFGKEEIGNRLSNFALVSLLNAVETQLQKLETQQHHAADTPLDISEGKRKHV